MYEVQGNFRDGGWEAMDVFFSYPEAYRKKCEYEKSFSSDWKFRVKRTTKKAVKKQLGV